LFLNIPLGVGVDFAFGKSDMKLGVSGDANVTGLPATVTQTSKGNVTATVGGDMSPSFANFKVMTGLGFSFGPVIIDIPISFYIGSGYSLGLTVGVAL
jgi:hypothetical protein